MNLYSLLRSRSKPIRVGLIGCGKFGSMFLAQVRRTPSMHVVGIADLSRERTHAALERVGWPANQHASPSLDAACASDGATCVTEDAEAVCQHDGVDVVIDATGSPAAGIRHALTSIEHGKHVVMVNVEADALVGPLLADRARAAGVVYSLAYGDQPALVAELVDWARACGLEVVAAGKGTKYLPEYHESTPDTVWTHYGLSASEAAEGGLNPQMFNSFLDGTKVRLSPRALCAVRPRPWCRLLPLP